jgi:hypothetical protein
MKTNLLGSIVLYAVFAPASTLAQNPTLLTTINNPAPALRDRFGWSLAAVNSDQVVIAAKLDDTAALNAGAAYLFRTNGAHLLTFTNPAPTADDEFGCSVAVLGHDRVLIGAWKDERGAMTDFGLAYLFRTNGALLTTFTNPAPVNYDYFGFAVAAVGSQGVLIGAYQKDGAFTDMGAAYLFDANGTLLTTFTNPAPTMNDWFGYAVSGVGNDRVLIGAPYDDQGATDAGTAYLFLTNGTLLTTFTNPTPAVGDWFGRSLMAVGSDRVLIGAPYDDQGATDAGAAYLFSTNGTLLTTFTNPTPAVGDWFGYSVAAVGDDRVLIGAYQDDTGATNAGAAYLFRSDGTLLTTLTNPAPTADDGFGWSLAAAGNDRVLISAYQDDAGATDAGVAYLFSIPTASTPRLAVNWSNSAVIVSWPLPAEGWLLHATTNLVPGDSEWTEIPPPYQTNGLTNISFTEPSPVGNKFYRLHKP